MGCFKLRAAVEQFNQVNHIPVFPARMTEKPGTVASKGSASRIL
jgi:hypothetical protein